MNVGVRVYFQAMSLLAIYASLVAQMIKNLPAMWKTWGSVPEFGRFPEAGNGYSLQYSGLENSMDRGAWWATVHGVEKSSILLCDFHFHLSCPGMGLQGHMIALFLVF